MLLPDHNASTSVVELRSRIVQNLEESRYIIEANAQLAQHRMKEQYDKNAAPVSFDVGSKVWVYTPKPRKGLSKKLAHSYYGPYRIVSKLSPVHFKLRTMNNRPVSVPVHANRMKRNYDPSDRPIGVPSLSETTPDLSETDMPADSFENNVSIPANIAADSNEKTEPSIIRREDSFVPAKIVPV